MKFQENQEKFIFHILINKRFNDIVNNNLVGSNYPRARTSANQEVTIGNVLDYLDRVVIEKNDLKDQVKNFKRNKHSISDKQSVGYNQSNPRSVKVVEGILK